MLTLCITGCQKEGNISDLSQVKFFIPDSQLNYWLIEERGLNDPTPKRVVEVIMELDQFGFQNGLELHNVEVLNGIANVNLNDKFEYYDIGDTGNYTNMLIIINTLCLNESMGVKAVQFMIDGEIIGSIGGSITDKPMYPNATLQPIY